MCQCTTKTNICQVHPLRCLSICATFFRLLCSTIRIMFEAMNTRKRDSVISRDSRDVRVRALMLQLEQWCSAERGRQNYIAHLLGVSRGNVNDWLTHRAVPS